MVTWRLVVLSAFVLGLGGCGDGQDPTTPSLTRASSTAPSVTKAAAVGPTAIIYTNFGPGMTFESRYVDLVIGQWSRNPRNRQTISQQFVTPPGQYVFERAAVALHHYSAFPTGAHSLSGPFQLMLQADFLGQPGPIIDVMPIDSVGDTPGIYVVNSKLTPILADSLYWLTLYADSGAVAGWHLNVTADSTGRRFAFTDDPDLRSTWFFQLVPALRAAFQVEGRLAKVDICHRPSANNSFVRISVAPSALGAHLAHGDGRPGEPVPGQSGTRFGPDCQVEIVPSHLTITPSAHGTVSDTGLYKDGVGDIAYPNDPLVQAIHGPALEYRGIVEFDISQVSQPVGHAELSLVVNSPFVVPFAVSVYEYPGDGAVTLGDFAGGTLLTSFPYTGQHQITVDITAGLNALITAHAHFAGLNFRVPLRTTAPFCLIAFEAFEAAGGPTPTLDIRNP